MEHPLRLMKLICPFESSKLKSYQAGRPDLGGLFSSVTGGIRGRSAAAGVSGSSLGICQRQPGAAQGDRSDPGADGCGPGVRLLPRDRKKFV